MANNHRTFGSVVRGVWIRFWSVIAPFKNVWVTAGCQLLCHQRDLSQYEVGKAVMDLELKYAPIVIKDGAHIGIGSIIMPGVTIGKGAVIGAGSVVTRDIPPYCVAVGVPCKVVKTFE